MSDAEIDCWSDVDKIPPQHSSVNKYLNMKPDTNVESSHLGNGRSIAKI